MFIATYFINLECALSYMIGSEIFAVYLAMTCSMVLLILLFEGINNLSVYFKTKKKISAEIQCMYQVLDAWVHYNASHVCNGQPLSRYARPTL
jgi:hypothetical protein